MVRSHGLQGNTVFFVFMDAYCGLALRRGFVLFLCVRHTGQYWDSCWIVTVFCKVMFGKGGKATEHSSGYQENGGIQRSLLALSGTQ